ncbi:hypothetical protein AB0442_36300 [Kitasatospora sp. NPDC085895]|uniref:hypothetical protein n=1 Tax=Kitasatospora sp. NPDC085895 TaxID=3155057 RepID=UPI00344EA46F
MAAPGLTAEDWDVVAAPPYRPGQVGEMVYVALLEIPDLHSTPSGEGLGIGAAGPEA